MHRIAAFALLPLLSVLSTARADPPAPPPTERDTQATAPDRPLSNLPGLAADERGGFAVATTQSSAAGLRTTVEAAIGRLRVSAGGAPGDTLLLGQATLGARLQLTDERTAGASTFVGTRWSAAGHEGRPEVAVSLAAEKHVGRVFLCGQVEVAREVDQDQRDGDLALAALQAISPRLAVGLAGHGTLDLDTGRADGGEIRWEASGGPMASLRLGGATLLLHGGAAALATPASARAGAFALASLVGSY